MLSALGVFQGPSLIEEGPPFLISSGSLLYFIKTMLILHVYTRRRILRYVLEGVSLLYISLARKDWLEVSS